MNASINSSNSLKNPISGVQPSPAAYLCGVGKSLCTTLGAMSMVVTTGCSILGLISFATFLSLSILPALLLGGGAIFAFFQNRFQFKLQQIFDQKITNAQQQMQATKQLQNLNKQQIVCQKEKLQRCDEQIHSVKKEITKNAGDDPKVRQDLVDFNTTQIEQKKKQLDQIQWSQLKFLEETLTKLDELSRESEESKQKAILNAVENLIQDAEINHGTAIPQSLKIKINGLTSRINERSAKIRQLEQELERQKAVNSELKSQNGDLTSANQSLETQNQTKEKEITGLNTKKQELETKINELENTIKEKTTAAAESNTALTELKNQLTALQAELNKQQKENKDLTTQNSELETQNQTKEKEITGLNTKKQELETKINELENTIKEKTTAAAESNTVLTELKEQHNKLQEQLKQKNEELKQKEDEINKLKNQNEEKQERITRLEDELNKLKIENEKDKNALNLELDQLKKENEGLKTRIDELQTKFNESDANNTLKEKEINTLKAHVNELEENLKSSNDSNVSLQNRIDELEQNLSGKINELSQANSENEELQEKFNNLQNEMQKKINNQSEEIKKLNDEIGKLTNENSGLKNEIKELKEKNKTKDEEINKLNSEAKNNNQIISDNSRTIEKLKKELQQAKNDQNAALEKIASLETTNKEFQNKINELESGINNSQNELERLNGELKSKNDELSKALIDLEKAKKDLEELNQTSKLKIQERDERIKTLTDQYNQCNEYARKLQEDAVAIMEEFVKNTELLVNAKLAPMVVARLATQKAADTNITFNQMARTKFSAGELDLADPDNRQATNASKTGQKIKKVQVKQVETAAAIAPTLVADEGADGVKTLSELTPDEVDKNLNLKSNYENPKRLSDFYPRANQIILDVDLIFRDATFLKLQEQFEKYIEYGILVKKEGETDKDEASYKGYVINDEILKTPTAGSSKVSESDITKRRDTLVAFLYLANVRLRIGYAQGQYYLAKGRYLGAINADKDTQKKLKGEMKKRFEELHQALDKWNNVAVEIGGPKSTKAKSIAEGVAGGINTLVDALKTAHAKPSGTRRFERQTKGKPKM